MGKKGFTLVELLAVIVILAVISLITTPMILGVIDIAKKGAAEQSAYGYIDAVEKQIAFNMIDSTKTYISDGTYPVSKLSEEKYGVQVKGQGPEAGWIKITSGEVVEYSLKIGEYVVNYKETDKKVEIIKNGTIDEEPDGTVKSGPTMVERTSSDTHKGIVYLDPTDLSKTCDASNSVSTTGTKTGCMKWYIYSKDDNNYTMILDHNTTPLVVWHSSGSNADGIGGAESALENDIASWNSEIKSTARLITADEIATITNNENFNSKTSVANDWFYFDGNSQIYMVMSGESSIYYWLYNYTYDCEIYGCTITDDDNYQYILYNGSENINYLTGGYWTSTPVASSSNSAWVVSNGSSLSAVGVKDTSLEVGYGIRPVITISKSIIQ